MIDEGNDYHYTLGCGFLGPIYKIPMFCKMLNYLTEESRK